MPPQVKQVKPPESYGKDALEYLEASGIVPVSPPIRSGDFEKPEFEYLLRRRYGLTEAMRYSSALSRGSYFHSFMEHFDEPNVDERVNDTYFNRCDELTLVREAYPFIPESAVETMKANEEQDLACSRGMFRAIRHIKCFSNGERTVFDFLNLPHFQDLGGEFRALSNKAGLTRVAQPDRLLYHTSQNALYVLDYKTCAENPLQRLETCPLEFQTLHYLSVLQDLIDEGILQKHFDLPEDVRLAQMVHIAFQKPSIEFGLKDRDYEEHLHTLKSGPRKGQTETRRTYRGEPRLENYVERCICWMLGEGEYLDKMEERRMRPAINTSYTSAKVLEDPMRKVSYWDAVGRVRDQALRPPTPIQFPQTSGHLRKFGQLAPTLPFYVNPVGKWPAIIRTVPFMVQHRDPDLTFDSPSGIYNAL